MPVRIDRVRYITAPRSSGRQMLSLGRLLRKYTPEPASEDVATCAEALDIAIEAGSQAYADRIRQDGPNLAREDSEDDGTVDMLLGILRERVGHWRVFGRPTFARLETIQALEGIEVADLVDKAEQAERVYQLLFASDFDATRAPYPEQAEYMLAVERIIDQAGLAAVLDQLVGGPFMAVFGDASVRYQEMVARRAAAAEPDVNLNDTLVSLRVAIQNYLIALLAMIRDDDADNVAMIRRALRPVDALREQLASASRPRSSGAGEVADGEVDRAAIEELVAEQEAVDAELGVADSALAEDPVAAV